MSAAKLPGIIRRERDLFETPNIYALGPEGKVEVYLANFRDNKQDRELVLFFEFQGDIYFPVWFEFRSINNNLLFLIEEYRIRDFTEVKRILLSSLAKEEHYAAEIKALVYRTSRVPSFSFRLPGFHIPAEDRIDVTEDAGECDRP